MQNNNFKTFTTAGEFGPQEVLEHLADARQKAHAVAADLAERARQLAAHASVLASIPNLPPGVISSAHSIASTLLSDASKIEQQLQRHAITAQPVAVAA